MHSFWEKNYWLPKVDFCIIGAGIVGLATSLFLREKYPDKTVMILERGVIPMGASTRNAGFACYGTAGEILDDLSHIPEEKVLETIKIRWEGLQLLKSMIPVSEMGYLNLGGYELFDSKSDYEECAAKLSKVNSLLRQATGVADTLQSVDYSHGRFYTKSIYNKYEAQLNPVELVSALMRKAEQQNVLIRQGIEVTDFQKHKDHIKLYISAPQIECQCSHLILATNAFTKKLCPEIDVIPSRNQVVVTSIIDNLDYKGTFHIDEGYIYFRNIGRRLLLGGARNIDPENEKTDLLGENPVILDYLKKFMSDKLRIDPALIEYKWSGIIATGESKYPIITRHSEQVYTAVRLGGMGVAIGVAVAKKLVQEHIDL